MRGWRAFVDWLPTLLASAGVLAKLFAMATMWSGSAFAAPLLAFLVIDFIPFKLADAASRLIFDRRGAAPSGAEMLVHLLLVLAVTAVEWCVVGVLVRRWLFGRHSGATPVRFR